MMQVKCWARCLAHGMGSLVGTNIISIQTLRGGQRRYHCAQVIDRGNRLREVKFKFTATNWPVKPQSQLHLQLVLAATHPLGVCVPTLSVPWPLGISSILDNP